MEILKTREVLPMKLETQQCIARNMRMLRTQQGVSQVRMAVDLGLTKAMYASYELGNREPDAEVLYNLALRCNIRMEYFFEKDPNEFLRKIAGKQYADDHMALLVQYYMSLSSFSKGMLIEKCNQLLERDKEIARNREALAARLAKK